MIQPQQVLPTYEYHCCRTTFYHPSAFCLLQKSVMLSRMVYHNITTMIIEIS